MFQARQDKDRTRGQLLREELGESVDHALRAAGHAAGGVRAASAQMRPTAERMREAASHRWESTMAAFHDADTAGRTTGKGGRRGTDAESRRWPKLAGLLAAGAVVGAVGAMIMRRRRQQEWAEYDPNEALEAVGASTAPPAPPPEAAFGDEAGDEGATGGSPHEAYDEEMRRSGRGSVAGGERTAATSGFESVGEPADELVTRSGGSRSTRSDT